LPEQNLLNAAPKRTDFAENGAGYCPKVYTKTAVSLPTPQLFAKPAPTFSKKINRDLCPSKQKP
jgi:hypothetical protein